MGIEDLTELEIVHGSTSLIFSIVGIIIGLTIAYKGYKSQQEEILAVGISVAFSRVTLLPAGISFITFIFFDFILPDTLYFFITYGITGCAIIPWMYAMTKFLFPQHLKKVLLIYIAIHIFFEILLITLLIVNPAMVATKEGFFNLNSGIIMSIFVIYSTISVLYTMFWFIRDCLKSKNLNTKWRGRFLLMSTLIVAFGIVTDSAFSLNAILLLVVRLILLVGVVINYLGWLLPKWLANWLIKENK
ncbi:MAG: hypothetical protein ACFFAN_04875 [Promethearchaeota archaeon]